MAISKTFVDIPGWEGYYQINRLGDVRSCERVILSSQFGGCRRVMKSKLLKQAKLRDYRFVTFCRNGKPIQFYVHRLVAMTFIPNPLGKREVNHKNYICFDNRVSNLEWVSSKENMHHAFAGKRIKWARGESNGKAILRTDQVIKIKLLLKSNTLTVSEVARKYGVSSNCISGIKNGYNWKHVNA